MRRASRIASIVLLPLLLVLLTPLAAASPELQETRDLCAYRVFYGYAATDGWGWNEFRYLHVVGLEDDTTVYLYDIKEKPLLKATVTINRMEVQRWDGDTSVVPIYFKIEADKPVVVTIYGGIDAEDPSATVGGRSYATFYPTVNGSFVGRDFIFEAHRGYADDPSWGGDFPAAILAVEDSTVEVYDATDTLLSTFNMAANTSTTYDFQTRTVYRVVSTGDIMIRSRAMEGRTLCPSTNGNFVGKMHFGSACSTWAIWVLPYEPCYIEVYNITATPAEQIANHTFTEAGEYWNLTGSNPGGSTDFYTVSTGLVSVGVGFIGPGWGAIGYPGYIGGLYTAEGAEYWVYGLQTWGYGDVVIFAFDDTAFTVNGTAYTLKADGHLLIPSPEYPGAVYHVVSDKPLTIIDFDGGGHWGIYLSSPSVTVKKPLSVRVKNLEESLEDFNTTINNKTAELLDRLSAAKATIRTLSVFVYGAVALDAVAIVMYIVERKQRIAQLKRRG